jgi:flotillin
MNVMPLAIVVGIAILISFIIWASRYTKVGPNEVLVISGRKRTVIEPSGERKTAGYRLVKGGGTFVLPIKEHVQRLSLELMTLEVRTPDVYTAKGVRVTVDAVAQVKVKGQEESIVVAAEQFLSRSQEDIMRVVLQTVEGHMRAILGTMTIEDIYTKRREFAEKVKEAAIPDLSKMGMEIVSLTIRKVTDDQGYLEALGKPRIAQVKRDAIIGEAEADREAQEVRFAADTKIEEARRDMEVKKADYSAAINQKRAEAELAYELQRYKTSQRVKEEEVKVAIVEKQKSVELEETEILRKEKELKASVEKPAEAERYRIQVRADAEKYRLMAEATGQAQATRSKGFAEAEVIKAQGHSEAETMMEKAQSWSNYNEAAVTEMFINILPKLAQAVSEPLSKTDKIVLISGNGDSAGASKVTRDVAQVIAQLPPVIESLTGVKLEDLIERIPGLKGKSSKAQETEGRG